MSAPTSPSPLFRRLIFLNRVYPREPGATGQLLAALAEGLARLDWDPLVVTSRGDKSCPRREMRNGVTVVRGGGAAFNRASFVRRLWSYLSVYPALLWNSVRVTRPHAFITMTDPPLLLVLGPVLAWLKRCRLVHWAQDVYPEVAEAVGVIREDGLVARVLRAVSTWALRRHDLIVAIGECMKQRLVQRGIDPDRIAVIPNWSLFGENDSSQDGSRFRGQQRWRDKFVVMYSGNFGLVHPFEAILEAARRLSSERPDVAFAFIGDGPRRATIEEQLRGLANVHWLPPQPAHTLPEVLRAADVHLASMSESTCGLVVPSKVYGIVAAERPCIFLGPPECEAGRLLLQNGCGEVLPSTDGEGLARVLQRWAEKPELLAKMRECAKALAPQVSAEAGLRAFATALERLAA